MFAWLIHHCRRWRWRRIEYSVENEKQNQFIENLFFTLEIVIGFTSTNRNVIGDGNDILTMKMNRIDKFHRRKLHHVHVRSSYDFVVRSCLTKKIRINRIDAQVGTEEPIVYVYDKMSLVKRQHYLIKIDLTQRDNDQVNNYLLFLPVCSIDDLPRRVWASLFELNLSDWRSQSLE